MLNASVRLSRGSITSPPKVRPGGRDSLPIFHRMHSDPIPLSETVQSHFQTEGEN